MLMSDSISAMDQPHEKHADTALPMLVTGTDGRTAWQTRRWPTQARGGMVLSPRIGCGSLRLRTSEPGYTADWHVADEPVLIVVQRGTLRIALRDGSTRDFSAGDAFIAADALADGEAFDNQRHGHRAAVVGDTPLRAVHIKLNASG